MLETKIMHQHQSCFSLACPVESNFADVKTCVSYKKECMSIQMVMEFVRDYQLHTEEFHVVSRVIFICFG